MQGREVEVAVLGNDAPIASVPGEVCYAGEWYDYETKYGAGQTTFKVPAGLPPETTDLVRALAVKAFQAIDGAGMARVDFFVEHDGRVLVNEINTIPGFTATSAYPRLWEASGIPYPELISRLIALALERRVRRADGARQRGRRVGAGCMWSSPAGARGDIRARGSPWRRPFARAATR